MAAVQERGLKPGEVFVRNLRTHAEFEACIALERRVWGGADADLVPLPIFVVAMEVGGQVLGAMAGKEMVGFTLAVPGVRRGQPFLHSHMTAVTPDYQNRGIGRMLKLAQREDAIARGIALVEWTFDPLELRNAYFNIERLGAIVRRLIPNCYGITSSPLHGGLPTDRLVAEWWVRSPRVAEKLRGPGAGDAAKKGEESGGRARRVAALPGVDVLRNIGELRGSNPEEAQRVQRRVREELQEAFARGWAVVGFEIERERAVYVLGEARDLEEAAGQQAKG